MKNKSSIAKTAFINGVFQGLAAPLMLFNVDELQIDRRSDLEKMRSDMLKVRGDFNVSFQKANQNNTKSA
jgi:hypothetical protein